MFAGPPHRCAHLRQHLTRCGLWCFLSAVAGTAIAFVGPKMKPLERQLQNAPAAGGNKKMNNF
jgi:hypothetical protein